MNLGMQDFGREILIKLVETIMQNRVQIKKNQIRKFNEIYGQIKNRRENAFDGDLQKLLEELLWYQRFGLRHQISLQENYHRIGILFELVSQHSGSSTPAELWLIDYDRYNQLEQNKSKQQFIIIIQVFEELLFFLNQQPLFLQYQKNLKFKNNYFIKHTLHFFSLKEEEKDNCFIKQDRIDYFRHKYIKERVTRQFIINISCSSLPGDDTFWQNPECPLINLAKNYQNQKKEGESTIDSSKKQCTSQIQLKQRKVSYYQIHDPQLQFVFLSSDDQEFKNSGKENIKKIQIVQQHQESEEFQLLFINKDQQLVQDIKEHLQELSQLYNQYLFHQ